MEFSLVDYNKINSNNAYFSPCNFFPYNNIDIRRYKALENKHNKSGMSIEHAFCELKKRTDSKYFNKVYPAQSSALNFSERSFPAYRFLVPEVLADDWLAIVDFHKKHNRDHALHQPLTAYIVSKLLGGGISKESFEINGKPLLDLCIDQIFKFKKTNYIKEYLICLGLNTNDNLLKNTSSSRFFWKNLFYETAMVAAIFHDMGYPWQYINTLNHSLNTSDFSTNNLSANAGNILNLFKNRLILYPFNGYNALSPNTPCNWEEKLVDLLSFSLSKTHGFPGAIGFLYLNDLIREFPTNQELPFHQFCVDWASLGIMMHDLGKVYWGDKKTPPDNKQLRLDFEKDPLSCIIALADVLEEFERPSVKFSDCDTNDGKKMNYHSPCIATNIEFNNGSLNINYKYENIEGVAAKLPFIKDDEYEYFDPAYGYLDFSSIEIKEVKLNAGL
jgi:hypothetical protein